MDEFHLVGRTETVWDNLNPDFVTKFYLPFATEEDQNARILLECYDQDSKDNEIVSQDYLKRQDFIGQVTFNVFEVRKRRTVRQLQKTGKRVEERNVQMERSALVTKLFGTEVRVVS